jgi:hypothetical protein
MTTDPQTILSGFKDPARYHRSGIVFARDLESAAQKLTMQLPADRLDWLKRTIASLRPNQQWVLQEPDAMIADLRAFATQPAPFLCRLVENFDLVLARWTPVELAKFWTAFSHLAKNAPHPVILLLPERGGFLGPQGPELVSLERDLRVVHL